MVLFQSMSHKQKRLAKYTVSGKIITFCQVLCTRIVGLLMRSLWSHNINNKVDFKSDVTYFFISNHQSRIDPFASFSVLSRKLNLVISPVRFMTASGIYYSAIRPLVKLLGCYPTRRKGVDIIELSKEYMQSGYSVFIFPEGRRVLRKDSDPRSGVERIIAAVPSNVIPVLIHIEWRKKGWRRHADISFQSCELKDLSSLSAKDIMQKVYGV